MGHRTPSRKIPRLAFALQRDDDQVGRRLAYDRRKVTFRLSKIGPQIFAPMAYSLHFSRFPVRSMNDLHQIAAFRAFRAVRTLRHVGP